MRKNIVTKKEGFWYSEHEPHFPNPKPNVLTVKQAKIISDKILELQKSCFNNRYKGYSTSRITDEGLRNANEYTTKDYKWCFPGDFPIHYVLEHRVKPSDDFLKYIGYESSN